MTKYGFHIRRLIISNRKHKKPTKPKKDAIKVIGCTLNMLSYGINLICIVANIPITLKNSNNGNFFNENK